jgi:hypothetical protein
VVIHINDAFVAARGTLVPWRDVADAMLEVVEQAIKPVIVLGRESYRFDNQMLIVGRLMRNQWQSSITNGRAADRFFIRRCSISREGRASTRRSLKHAVLLIVWCVSQVIDGRMA